MATYSPVPTSTVQSATGASFTVATGTYAIARLYCGSGGTFSVNGTLVLSSGLWNTIAAASPGGTGNLVSGSTIAVLTVGSGTTPLYTNSVASDTATASLILVTGDVLTGAGGTTLYHIEIYPL